MGMYDWAGRTMKFHRAQIRDYLGFRECGLADAEKLASWLATAAAAEVTLSLGLLKVDSCAGSDQGHESPTETRLGRPLTRLCVPQAVPQPKQGVASVDARPGQS